ncbi:MAG: glycosyltransferase family 2 protein [Bacilli bacterium]|nr:glycosyltransferase family 2 protein [Bacilli bacterium]
MKKNTDKLFSLIIPCYNSENYLPRLLNSINNQTYKNLEIILINDGSSDNTKKIIQDFKKESIYKVIIINKKNEGLGAAINDGLKLVTGDYFSYINSDDIIFDDYVERYVNIFNKDTSVHVIQRNGYMVPEDELDKIGEKEFPMISDWNTNPFDENLFFNMLLEVNYNFTYVAIRTTSFDKVLPDRDIYESRDGQNYQILLPMFYNYKSTYIVDPGIYFVERKKSLSRNYKNEQPEKLYEMYDEYKKIILKTLEKMNLSEIDYLKKLIEQKYIVKKLEYAKFLNRKNDIDVFEKMYIDKVINDNIYEKELKKVREKYPLVSIIIPVYNGANYMREAIDSALNQDYSNIEIIVVNDGSTDNGETEKIALSYGDKIRYFKKENGGVSTALNFGISKMNGYFFSWLSHDDRYYKNKISTQIYYLINNNLMNKNVITYTNYDVINENSEIISKTAFQHYRPNEKPELALLRGLISGTALLIPKQAFEDFGTFDTNYRCVQDYLLFFSFMKKYRYVFIPEITNSTRVHSKQVTNSNPKVIEENNFLWIKMQKEVSDKTKIKLMHSLYDFYIRMDRYLRSIASYSNNDYVGAREYSLDCAKECLNKGREKFEQICKKYTKESIYKSIINIYNECNKFPVFDGNQYDKNKLLEQKLHEIINMSGLYNTIEFASIKDNNIIYNRMLNALATIYPYYNLVIYKNDSSYKKLKKSIKNNGIVYTFKLIIRRIINKLKQHKIVYLILKITRIILKLILFIPKLIIKFILYV